MRKLPASIWNTAAQRLGYEEWKGANRLDGSLLVWEFVPAERQFPGWTAHTIQRIAAPGWPQASHSVWIRGAGGAAVVDLYECVSRDDAHDLVVRLLAQFESPEVAPEDEPEAGDVAFSDARGRVRVFARANLVCHLRTGDREPVEISAAAARLDRQLTSGEGTPVFPARALVDTAPAVVRGATVALDVAPEAPPRGPGYLKAFSPTGELRMGADGIVYAHEADGPPQVEISAVAL